MLHDVTLNRHVHETAELCQLGWARFSWRIQLTGLCSAHGGYRFAAVALLAQNAGRLQANNQHKGPRIFFISLSNLMAHNCLFVMTMQNQKPWISSLRLDSICCPLRTPQRSLPQWHHVNLRQSRRSYAPSKKQNFGRETSQHKMQEKIKHLDSRRWNSTAPKSEHIHTHTHFCNFFPWMLTKDEKNIEKFPSGCGFNSQTNHKTQQLWQQLWKTEENCPICPIYHFGSAISHAPTSPQVASCVMWPFLLQVRPFVLHSSELKLNRSWKKTKNTAFRFLIFHFVTSSRIELRVALLLSLRSPRVQGPRWKQERKCETKANMCKPHANCIKLWRFYKHQNHQMTISVSYTFHDVRCVFFNLFWAAWSGPQRVDEPVNMSTCQHPISMRFCHFNQPRHFGLAAPKMHGVAVQVRLLFCGLVTARGIRNALQVL